MSLHFSTFHCISLSFSAFSTFLFIALHFSAFLYISLPFSTFHCIYLNLSAFIWIKVMKSWGYRCISEFLCIFYISLHISKCLLIFLHFSEFLWISLHFTFYILGQFGGAYRHFLSLSITAILSSLATDVFTHVYN